MKNLTHRTLSAAIAIFIFSTVMYFFAESGVYVMVLFTVTRGSYEMSRMFFKKTYQVHETFLLKLYRKRVVANLRSQNATLVL